MTGIPGMGGFCYPKSIFDSFDENYSKGSNFKETLDCSVIIPTCIINTDVENLLNVLLKEKLLIREIIIVIDGPEILANHLPLKFKIKPVRIFCTGKQMGCSVARNVGLDVASGDIILFLDSDCMPEEGIVQTHLKKYTKSNVVAVGGIVDFVGNNSLQSRLVMNSCLLDAFSQAKRYERLWWNPTANFSIKREALGNTRFDDSFPKKGGGEDVFIGFMLKKEGRIIAEPNAVVKHPVWSGWRNLIRRFFRWGWAEAILTAKAKKSSDLDIPLVRRELSIISLLFISFIFSLPFVFLFSNKTILLVSLGVFLGWEIAAIFSPRRKKPILDEMADQFFCLVFDLGSTLGRLTPKGWNGLNSRIVFYPDQLYALWENTQLCERAGFFGGFIVFLLSIAFG